MLGHNFVEMPGKSIVTGDNPHETVMLMRCEWCLKTPMKARTDGCPTHELEAIGTILLSDYNPEGVEHFKGRLCVTCEQPIMGHALRKGLQQYWCFPNQNVFSDGITDCVWDVDGVVVPAEPTNLQHNLTSGESK